MSNTTLVVKSKPASFPQDQVDVAQNKAATIGESLRLDCQLDRQSVPSPRLVDFWWRDNNKMRWQLSQRVQIDDNGMYAEAK